MTTTKNTTVSPAAASRAALAAARTKAADWLALHDAAELAAEELVERLARGDDSVTVEELVSSKVAAERAAVLVKAGESIVKKAERALVNDDTKLADLFAVLLADAFEGVVPVKVQTIKATPSTGELVAIVLQAKPGTDRGGILSGELTLFLYRSALLAPLSADRVTQLAKARGFVVEVVGASTTKLGTDHEDALRLRVRRAFAATPVLPTAPGAETTRYFAQGVPGSLTASLRATNPNAGFRLTGDAPAPNARGELVSHRVIGTEKSGTGGLLTVEVVAKVHPSPYLKINPYPLIVDTIAQYVGSVEAGLGRIVEVGKPSINSPERTASAYVPAITVTVQFVFSYQLAA